MGQALACGLVDAASMKSQNYNTGVREGVGCCLTCGGMIGGNTHGVWIILVGTGLLSAAGMARRRLLK